MQESEKRRSLSTKPMNLTCMSQAHRLRAEFVRVEAREHQLEENLTVSLMQLIVSCGFISSVDVVDS